MDCTTNRATALMAQAQSVLEHDDREHTDDDLVSAARSAAPARWIRCSSATSALFTSQCAITSSPARRFDDAHQEARIGFFKAIQTYKPDGGTTFAPFCRMSMERNVISALKTAQRLKRQVLNQASSLDRPRVDDNECYGTLVDFIADPQSAELECIAVHRALHAALVDAVMGAGLWDLEAAVLLA